MQALSPPCSKLRSRREELRIGGRAGRRARRRTGGCGFCSHRSSRSACWAPASPVARWRMPARRRGTSVSNRRRGRVCKPRSKLRPSADRTMSGLRSRRPPGPAAAARATWPRCRPTSRSPRRWRVSPCAGAQNSPCRRRRSSLTAWSVPLAPEPSLSAPSGVALVLFAEGCQSCASTVAASRVARSLLVPPTPGCPALRRASHHSPLPNSTGRRSAVQPGRCLFARPGWVRRRVTPDATPALPFFPSPFRSRGPPRMSVPVVAPHPSRRRPDAPA